MIYQLRSWVIVFIAITCLGDLSFGQTAGSSVPAKSDTLHFSLQDAEKIMIDKNLDLIANHFNIDIAHAQTIAAKLWDNPGFSYGQNIINPGHHVFSIQGPDGEVFLQIDQVFKIAGKRHRLVQ